MKKLFYLITLVSVVALTLCKKFLDKKPQTQIVTTDFWKKEDDIKAGIAGMYSGMQDITSTNFFYWGDARSDNHYDNPKYGNASYFNNALSSSINGSDWSPVYRVIGRANDLLKHVPKVKA